MEKEFAKTDLIVSDNVSYDSAQDDVVVRFLLMNCVYILKCADGSYYTGCTSNIDDRLNQHARGNYSSFTSARLPIELIFKQEFESMEEAIRAEKMIKGWSRKKKEALINLNFDLLHELAKCQNPSSHKFKNR